MLIIIVMMMIALIIIIQNNNDCSNVVIAMMLVLQLTVIIISVYIMKPLQKQVIKNHNNNLIFLFREIATITYRSGPEWKQRFGRKLIDPAEPPSLCPSFEIEEYIMHQGETFSNKYDPNSLLYISKVSSKKLFCHWLCG